MLGRIIAILGSPCISKFARAIQLTLFLQFVVDTKSNYMPEFQPRRPTPSLRQESPNPLSSKRIRCWHCVDCPGSNSARSKDYLPEKNLEAQISPKSLPKHTACRQNGFCDVRAPKLSRSTETVYLDMPESLLCGCLVSLSEGLAPERYVGTQSGSAVVPNKTN
jgi:hypothetical protein